MATHLPPDPYAALGVAKDAQLAEVRSAHRKLILKCHPDRVQDPALKAIKQDEFQKIQEAYEILSNEARREQYDSQVKFLELRKEMKKSPNFQRTSPPKTPRTSTCESSYETYDRYGSGDKGRPIPIRRNAMVFEKNDWEAEDSRRPRSSIRKSDPPTIRKRSQGIQVVRGHLNGLETYAIPDSGAEFNIMAAEFEKSAGLSVDNEDLSKCRLLRMANGKHIKTIGIVDVKWGFASDPSQEWKLTFHILADFVYDLILGSQFLFATQTMSHHKERLSTIPRPLQSLSVLRVNVLGSASRQVRGSLQEERVNALPDSGSEPSLLSYEYVKRRGWLLNMKMENQNLLQFADGSVEKTEGSLSARWVFPAFPSKTGTKKKQTSLNVEFHVLRGCSHNVILGQDVLDETDTFLQHADAFFDVSSETEASGLNLVIWLPKKKKKVEIPSNTQSSTERNSPARLHDDLHIELQRRAAVDRKLNRMPWGTEKVAALETEAHRRQDYDAYVLHIEDVFSDGSIVTGGEVPIYTQ